MEMFKSYILQNWILILILVAFIIVIFITPFLDKKAIRRTYALTGLLNRQAYYAETSRTYKDITAIISLDMNGLKKVNDTYGHDAGDEALETLVLCFARACKVKQSAYRTHK